jgi:hypothetical protein
MCVVNNEIYAGCAGATSAPRTDSKERCRVAFPVRWVAVGSLLPSEFHRWILCVYRECFVTRSFLNFAYIFWSKGTERGREFHWLWKQKLWCNWQVEKRAISVLMACFLYLLMFNSIMRLVKVKLARYTPWRRLVGELRYCSYSYLRGKDPRYPLDMRLGVPQSRSGRRG